MELLKNLEGMSADEQMTAVVELQKAAMKQLEEQKQVSIGKSAEMVIQGLKKIKSDFEAKFDSLNYDIQAKVSSLKDGEQGIQGPKGDQGDRGLDGANGRDGRDGKDGRDGLDGVDGVGVRDAKIDFDGSLVISLTDGREINCGEVVSVDVAKQIQKVTHNIQTGSGGDSQTVLDAIAAIQATIATYGTMATQNKTSVDIEGGTIDNTVIGGTTPAAGTFTTLTATGQTSLGGVAGSESLRVLVPASAGAFMQVQTANSSAVVVRYTNDVATNVSATHVTRGTSPFVFSTGGSTTLAQFSITNTNSAVNYVQVTGNITSNSPQISFTGSDAGVGGALISKGNGAISFFNNGTTTSRQFRVGAGVVTTAVNYINADGSATGNATQFQTYGTDTNIAMALRTSGTGAIDLAAGSSGVNISNGGTVTALTRTAGGTLYTSVPSVAITAPTTAGGVQATASCVVTPFTLPTIVSGGTGYTVNDVVTFVGGTGTAYQALVTSVSGGVITGISTQTAAAYSVVPTNPISVTGGTGSGATFSSVNYTVTATLTITNAGSGYVEQPTVSFSGGGGSGAAAYATVGSAVILKSIGGTLDLSTTNGIGLRIYDSGGTVPSSGYWAASSGTSSPFLWARGGTNTPGLITSSGTGAISIQTNSGSHTQFNVAHTASAVNYVQVTGAATGSRPALSAQGSDSSIGLTYVAKGTGSTSRHAFQTGSGTQFLVVDSGVGTVNTLQVYGSASGSAPVLSSQGSDTNIDLALTPKGTGNVRFGTYTANMALTIQGYIEIKDSGGTIRKLAVIA